MTIIINLCILKLFFKIGLSNIFNKINNEVLKQIDLFNPDYVLVFKGMEIFPETLKSIKTKGIKIINFNADNPFIFSGEGSGNQNVTKSLSLYSLHLTYNMEVKKTIEYKFNIPAEILPFGFDIDDNLFLKCAKEKEILKACFLGNPNKERAEFITSLAKEGISMDVYGNHWHKWLSESSVNIYPPVYQDELWETLRKYRVQLNLMRVHNLNSHNMRTFEVPGIGGIMVAPKTVDHLLYFTDQKDVFLFETLSECATTIKMLLALSYDDANKIRGFARERSVESGYTYRERAKQLLVEIKKI